MGATTAPVSRAARVRPWMGRILVVGVTALGVVLLWLLTWPPTHPEGPTDAVVVLSGSSARLDRGLALVEAGLAPTLVVSNGDQRGWVRGNVLCSEPQPFEVICFRPRPQTTVGEARAIAGIAEQEGWQHVTVVTSPSHVTRARILVGQCTATTVAMATHSVDLQSRLRLSTIVRESVGLAAGLTVARAC